MQTIWQDMRYGIRMLANRPGFTIVHIHAGARHRANTAIFTIVMRRCCGVTVPIA
jgi:hypothetical protein